MQGQAQAQKQSAISSTESLELVGTTGRHAEAPSVSVNRIEAVTDSWSAALSHRFAASCVW